MKHKIEGSQHRAREEKVQTKNRLEFLKFWKKKKPEEQKPNYLIYRPKRKNGSS